MFSILYVIVCGYLLSMYINVYVFCSPDMEEIKVSVYLKNQVVSHNGCPDIKESTLTGIYFWLFWLIKQD